MIDRLENTPLLETNCFREDKTLIKGAEGTDTMII